MQQETQTPIHYSSYQNAIMFFSNQRFIHVHQVSSHFITGEAANSRAALASLAKDIGISIMSIKIIFVVYKINYIYSSSFIFPKLSILWKIAIVSFLLFQSRTLGCPLWKFMLLGGLFMHVFYYYMFYELLPKCIGDLFSSSMYVHVFVASIIFTLCT